MSRLIFLLIVLSLGACASTEKHDANQMEALRLHYAAQKPLVKIEAVPGQQITGLASIEINVPQNAPVLSAPAPHPIWQTLNAALPFIGMVGIMNAATHGAIGVANAVANASKTPQANVSNITNTTSSTTGATINRTASTTTNTTTSSAATIGGSGVIGAGSFSQPTTNAPVTNTTTDNHTTNPSVVTQVPAGRVCTIAPVTGLLTCI